MEPPHRSPGSPAASFNALVDHFHGFSPHFLWYHDPVFSTAHVHIVSPSKMVDGVAGQLHGSDLGHPVVQNLGCQTF